MLLLVLIVVLLAPNSPNSSLHLLFFIAILFVLNFSPPASLNSVALIPALLLLLFLLLLLLLHLLLLLLLFPLFLLLLLLLLVSFYFSRSSSCSSDLLSFFFVFVRPRSYTFSIIHLHFNATASHASSLKLFSVHIFSLQLFSSAPLSVSQGLSTTILPHDPHLPFLHSAILFHSSFATPPRLHPWHLQSLCMSFFVTSFLFHLIHFVRFLRSPFPFFFRRRWIRGIMEGRENDSL